ncbi:hypothetical protein [Vibrio crassostreae]|uniref:hypothetical protein n=1 Tax=Vibrio crassostreae TaxID=246167 RepID=UPI001B318223|nr:hypothetical protein [Vibrio crassostreae]
MKVEQQTDALKPTHDKVVFASKEDAQKKDLTRCIGRFDEPRKSIVFIDDNGVGTKYKALMQNGLQIHLAKDDRNNYYITDLIDNISKAGQNLGVHESLEVEPTDNNVEERPELVFKTAQEFMEQDIDSAMDIDFTTEALNYEHRVGLYNEDAQSYTLRDDVKDFLDDFEFKIDETEEGVLARISPESLQTRKLLKLVNLLKQQEQDSDEELKEALESNKVQFDSLPIVKSLLRRLALCHKHGDVEEADDAELELNELIAHYKNSTPPAAGIDKAEVQRDSIKVNESVVKRALKSGAIAQSNKNQNMNESLLELLDIEVQHGGITDADIIRGAL